MVEPGLGPRTPEPHTTALVLCLRDDLSSSAIRGRQCEEAVPAFQEENRQLNRVVFLQEALLTIPVTTETNCGQTESKPSSPQGSTQASVNSGTDR